MKINWQKVFKVLKVIGTIITTVVGTLAVQNCTPHWFKFMGPRKNICDFRDFCVTLKLSVGNEKNRPDYYPLLRSLKVDYPDAKILGHRDLPWVKKDCPCFDARAEYLTLTPLKLEQ